MAHDSLPLDDGWYPIPGDGKVGDENRRCAADGYGRFYHYVHVTNGVVDALYGNHLDPDYWKLETSPPFESRKAYLRSYKKSQEIDFQELLASTLVPDIDEWEHEYELNN